MSLRCRVGLHDWRYTLARLGYLPEHGGLTLRRCGRCGIRRRPR